MLRRHLLNLAVGVELGLLAIPIGALIVPDRVVAAGVFVGCAVIGYAGGTSAEDPLVSLSTRPGILLILGPPMAYVVVFLYGAVSGASRIAWIGVGGMLAFVPAIVTVVVGADERWRRTIEAATIHATFEARPPPRRRRLVLAAAGLFFVGGPVGLVAPTGYGGTLLDGSTAGSLFLAGLLMAGSMRYERQVRVTDAGLSVNRTVHSWSNFEGVSVSEDAISVGGAGYGKSWEFDREDVAAEDDVIDSVSRFLDPGDPDGAAVGERPDG